MQNVPLTSVRETGVLTIGCSPSVTHGFLDLVDFAEVARTVILSPIAHNFATYELLSQNLSYASMMETLSAETGKQVECEVLSMKEFVTRNGHPGAEHGEYSQDAAERMVFYFDRWSVVASFVPHTPRSLPFSKGVDWELQYSTLVAWKGAHDMETVDSSRVKGIGEQYVPTQDVVNVHPYFCSCQ